MSLISEIEYKAKTNRVTAGEISAELKGILDARQPTVVTRHGWPEAYLIPTDLFEELMREYHNED